MKSRNRAVSFLANMGLLAFSLLFFEFALQVASIFFEWREHDARGFRNASALDSTAIVALGDSHTYGTSVSSKEAWPSILSARLGEDVYNMGLGGYGPARNNDNLPTAIELKPRWIIFGLYFGNDFYDDFQFAQKNGRLSEFASDDVLREISELEKQRTIAEEVGFLFNRGGRNRDVATDRPPSEVLGPPGFLRVVGNWLTTHSRLYGLARVLTIRLDYDAEFNALLARDFDKAKAKLTDRQLPFVSFYDGRDWQTIFTSPYRFRVMDLADPRIRTGIEISKHMLEQMRLRVSESGAKYLVLLLPTKEYVFWPRVENPNQHKLLAELAQDEDRIRNEIKRYMQDHGIDFVDPVPELRQSERQPYFSDGDGHPNALGHQIIAKKTLEFIKGNQI